MLALNPSMIINQQVNITRLKTLKRQAIGPLVQKPLKARLASTLSKPARTEQLVQLHSLGLADKNTSSAELPLDHCSGLFEFTGCDCG